MRYFLAIACSAAFSILCIDPLFVSMTHASSLKPAPGIAIPDPPVEAPDFTLPTLRGEEIRLADFRDKVVLINFWATWCGPCRDEMPAMEQLWNRFKDQGFAILAISLDKGSRKRIDTFIRKSGLTYPILLDPQEGVSKQYNLVGLPGSYLIGRDGKIRGKIAGPIDWTSPETTSFIESLLMGSGL